MSQYLSYLSFKVDWPGWVGKIRCGRTLVGNIHAKQTNVILREANTWLRPFRFRVNGIPIHGFRPT